MAGTITPLPVMLEEEEDRKRYEKLEAPKSLVVRYGFQKLIAELPYDGEAKPGCGSKIVIRTQRGIELGEMLTSTCPNAGCSKSVTRKQMLQYIENSGGKDFPFTDQGKALRVATPEDVNEQARLDAQKPEIIKQIKGLIRELDLDMRLVEVELLLGGERMLVYYTAEQRVDFRELVRRLASTYHQRIEMRQVNAREEARLVADYEKCGQHCCCKQFLKVLKPVSMRSAKVQKATLDPLKISGRCGRLMCCLRYEDETYEDLRRRLPHRKTLVETEDGIGEVQDSQILTQLVLVQIGDAAPQAYPVEEIRVLDKEQTRAHRQREADASAEAAAAAASRSSGRRAPSRANEPAKKPAAEKSAKEPVRDRQDASASSPRRPKPGKPLTEGEVESREGTSAARLDAASPTDASPSDAEANASDAADSGDTPSGGQAGEQADAASSDAAPQKGKRRRRRGRGRGRGGRRRGKGDQGGDAASAGGTGQ